MAILPSASVSASDVRGHQARVITVNDTAHLKVTNPQTATNDLVEVGQATGTLPGRVRANLALGTSTVSVQFTVYLHNGSITGHSIGRINVGEGEWASFKGKLKVSHGTGHYGRAFGTGNVYGTINRNTDNANVQVIGRLHL